MNTVAWIALGISISSAVGLLALLIRRPEANTLPVLKEAPPFEPTGMVSVRRYPPFDFNKEEDKHYG